MFAALNAITAWVHHFTTDRDSTADIVPAADLPDGKNIARLQQNICIGFAGQSASDGNFAVIQVNVVAIDDGIAGEIGSLTVAAQFR